MPATANYSRRRTGSFRSGSEYLLRATAMTCRQAAWKSRGASCDSSKRAMCCCISVTSVRACSWLASICTGEASGLAMSQRTRQYSNCARFGIAAYRLESASACRAERDAGPRSCIRESLALPPANAPASPGNRTSDGLTDALGTAAASCQSARANKGRPELQRQSCRGHENRLNLLRQA